MHLCDDGHEEIVYGKFSCPLCKANEEIENLTNEVNSLGSEIETLKDEVDELKTQEE